MTEPREGGEPEPPRPPAGEPGDATRREVAGDADWQAGWGAPAGGSAVPPPPPEPPPSPASPPGAADRGDAAPALRPMGVGDVLDGTVRLLVGHWRVVLATVAAVSVPVQLLFVAIAPEMATTGPLQAFSDGFAAPDPFDAEMGQPLEWAALWRAQAFAVGQLLIVSPLIAGAVVHLVGRSRLDQPTGVGRALRAALGRLPVLVAVRVLLVLMGLVAVLVVGAGSAGLVAGLGPAGFAVVLLLLAVAGVAAVGVLTLFAVVTPAVMLERLGPLAALGRSASLVRRRFWPTLGKVVLVVVLVGIVSQALSLLALPAELLPGGVAYVAATTLVGIVTAPLLPIALVLVYLDLRVRTEGLDLYAALQPRPGPGAAAG